MAITKDELDRAQCTAEHGGLAHIADHGPLYFHSRCHPSSPTWTFYDKGELVVTCAAWMIVAGRRCEQEIVRIAVAEELTQIGWIVGRGGSALGAHNHFPPDEDSIWAKPNVLAAHRECRPVYVAGPWPGACPGPAAVAP